MNVRPLTTRESADLAALNAAGVTSSLLFVTATGLEKSILDATVPMRAMFKDAGIHDYERQGKGQHDKVMTDAVILKDDGVKESRLSLYRPTTKDGDPRMWFYGLKEGASPDSVFAVFILARTVHAMNLSTVHLGDSTGASQVLTNFFAPLRQGARVVADELLTKLRDLAQMGPIQATGAGDTAVGMSIEAALGIPANSSRKPDYKGIEQSRGGAPLAFRQHEPLCLHVCWTGV